MNDIAEKILKQMYDEYLRTSESDWQSINSSVGRQLESLGFVEQNVQGDFRLTDAGIEHMQG